MKTKKINPVSVSRSEVMRSVRSKDTKPELIVRRLLFFLGYRYRLHRKDLPGNPDIVFPGRKKIIFVNGCFWHGHSCKRGSRVPKNNQEYWVSKIHKNIKRDKINREKLKQLGWKVLTVWECEIKNYEKLKNKLDKFLK